MDIKTAWQNVEQAAIDMENGQGDYQIKIATLYAAIDMLLDYPVKEVVAQVEASYLPTRPTMSWLVYEGSRIKGIDHSRAEVLKKFWNKNNPEDQKIMEGPKGVDLV
jgi:hypothetical protein